MSGIHFHKTHLVFNKATPEQDKLPLCPSSGTPRQSSAVMLRYAQVTARGDGQDSVPAAPGSSSPAAHRRAGSRAAGLV